VAAALVLALDELVVGRGTTEARRQNLVDQPQQVGAEKVHTLVVSFS
jgi:hypothetical protein